MCMQTELTWPRVQYRGASSFFFHFLVCFVDGRGLIYPSSAALPKWGQNTCKWTRNSFGVGKGFIKFRKSPYLADVANIMEHVMRAVIRYVGVGFFFGLGSPSGNILRKSSTKKGFCLERATGAIIRRGVLRKLCHDENREQRLIWRI